MADDGESEKKNGWQMVVAVAGFFWCSKWPLTMVIVNAFRWMAWSTSWTTVARWKHGAATVYVGSTMAAPVRVAALQEKKKSRLTPF